MRKYAGLSLVLVMCISTAMAYGLARTANASSLNNGGNEGDVMLKTMDSSLAAKLRDYLEIIDQLQKQAGTESQGQTGSPANLLSGGKAPVPQITRKAPPVTVAPAKPQPDRPWWSDYELNMVVYSNQSRTAVVNGKFVREGDTVRNGVAVKKIDKQSVTLEYKGNGNMAPHEHQDDLKTLYVKAK